MTCNIKTYRQISSILTKFPNKLISGCHRHLGHLDSDQIILYLVLINLQDLNSLDVTKKSSQTQCSGSEKF